MKTHVLILCGGRSQEHEISLISAHSILQALDRTRFHPIVVGIAKNGVWYLENEAAFYEGNVRADSIRLNTQAPAVQIAPYTLGGRGVVCGDFGQIRFDVVFPILHGPFGEDGTLQGLLEMVGVPYVGSGCGSSYICMDKEITKLLARTHQIPTADFVTVRDVSQIGRAAHLGFPVFVKPSRLGSSVGISKAADSTQLKSAVTQALKHDTKCLIEQMIHGRELECAVLGHTEAPQASLPAEIIAKPSIGWYSYEAKYLLEDGAQTIVPARLGAAWVACVQELAVRSYQIFECEGMARVDLFLDETRQQLYLNEINTVPGFTSISLYPKMWVASAIPYRELVTRLIDLALDKRRT